MGLGVNSPIPLLIPCPKHDLSVMAAEIVLTILVSNCEGARFNSRDFKVRNASPRTMVGFLPKTTSIPPSAPCKEHNDIERREWFNLEKKKKKKKRDDFRNL
ncbi:hypothetical protein ACOSQ4_018416 [Xanthoceras sorbifolium]